MIEMLEVPAVNADRVAEQFRHAPAKQVIRACSNCETHGQCKRHFITGLVDFGMPPEEVKAQADALPDSAWCPDLDQVSAVPVAELAEMKLNREGAR
jgi:hypothetical protein